MKELLAKLPAEIAEKLKAETITDEEIKEYVLPLAEQYKDKVEDDMTPLSEELLENVSGSVERNPNFFSCLFIRFQSRQPGNNLEQKCKEAGYTVLSLK